MIFDLAIGVVRLGLAARHARQHVLGFAEIGGHGGLLSEALWLRLSRPCRVGWLVSRSRIRRIAGNLTCEPFADGKALAPRRGPGRFARFWRYPGNIPRKVSPHPTHSARITRNKARYRRRDVV